ncbi:spore protease YyaC [Clostridium ljungdahlii]|uniref:Sporulation protein YyaC n=1 Tax=Clostridium ljungdahlii TaxID=1538 RepID=A0A168MS53_9CLOT|nr:spore protease YyaC [Clostridium ljungdahlii]OAA85085.1 hypothetical protein WY13_02570 [Clostridium ljungdahlii]
MKGVCVNYYEEGAYKILGEALKDFIDDKTIIVNIGTDGVLGDCIGPLLGSMLVGMGLQIPVIGTLNDPIHAGNCTFKILEIKKKFAGYKVVAVDSCLGKNVGYIKMEKGSIKVGAGISKKYAEVGDVFIKAIVAGEESAKKFAQLKIRLRYIYNMSLVIAEAILYASKKGV